MIKPFRGRERMLRQTLAEASPLRRADPRAKLAVSLAASLAVMSPALHLAAFIAAFAVFLAWARLLPHAAQQTWRLRWVLVLLFVLDWLIVGPDLAVIISLRLVLLAGAFVLFFATTTPAELCLALERLRLPYRYAFSISLAFQSLGFLADEWRAIREAQQAAGRLCSSCPSLGASWAHWRGVAIPLRTQALRTSEARLSGGGWWNDCATWSPSQCRRSS